MHYASGQTLTFLHCTWPYTFHICECIVFDTTSIERTSVGPHILQSCSKFYLVLMFHAKGKKIKKGITILCQQTKLVGTLTPLRDISHGDNKINFPGILLTTNFYSPYTMKQGHCLRAASYSSCYLFNTNLVCIT